MSFNKKYLQPVDEIIKAIEMQPSKLYRSLSKTDAFFGSESAINLTHEFIEKYKENSEQDFSELIAKYK